jgi:hypothetical protein
VSEGLTESSEAHEREGQPARFFSPRNEQTCGASRSRSVVPRVAIVPIRRSA